MFTLMFHFIQGCPNPDLMKNPAYIPDGQITSNVQASDGSSPNDARIGGKSFNPPVPKSAKDAKPLLKVRLSATADRVATSKIIIPPASTNIKKVTVLVPADQYQSYGSSMTTPSTITLSPGGTVAYVPILQNVQPDPTSGQVPFPTEVKVTEVVIIAESVKNNPDGSKPATYKIVVGIHACLNGKLNSD